MTFRLAARLLVAGVLALVLCVTPAAGAVQRLEIVDEGAVTAAVSARDVNVITAPSTVIQAYTSKPDIEVKTQGRHVLVTTGTAAGELVILTDQQVYVLQLKPGNGPSETIILSDRRGADAASDPAAGPAQDSADYVDGLTTVMRTVFLGETPPGVEVVETPKDQRLSWVELELVQDRLYHGRAYLLRRLEWRNDTGSTQTLREQAFYTGRELAIGLDRVIVEPGQSVVGVLVYPAPRREAAAPTALPPADQ